MFGCLLVLIHDLKRSIGIAAATYPVGPASIHVGYPDGLTPSSGFVFNPFLTFGRFVRDPVGPIARDGAVITCFVVSSCVDGRASRLPRW